MRVESAPSNALSITYAIAATIVDSDADGLSDADEDENHEALKHGGE